MNDSKEALWKEYDTALAARSCGRDSKPGADAGVTPKSETLNKKIWTAQVKVCLPLIEIERNAFITDEYGRLQPIIGTEYWNEKTQDYRTLGYDGGEQVIEDPYELDIVTLYKLGFLRKRLVMLNTYSYAAFFNMFPEDRERLGFIAGLWKKLAGFTLCNPDELEQLFAGHESFMSRGK